MDLLGPAGPCWSLLVPAGPCWSRGLMDLLALTVPMNGVHYTYGLCCALWFCRVVLQQHEEPDLLRNMHTDCLL
ncbi:hypothetical protein VZT92_009287 [Zoarces viviparus]|uniref:Uncharacterized protein n=1 Tax=Zoarces viviparus TaxID=48416 RepID=A0AAW1FHX0_ZOAVI